MSVPGAFSQQSTKLGLENRSETGTEVQELLTLTTQAEAGTSYRCSLGSRRAMEPTLFCKELAQEPQSYFSLLPISGKGDKGLRDASSPKVISRELVRTKVIRGTFRQHSYLMQKLGLG